MLRRLHNQRGMRTDAPVAVKDFGNINRNGINLAYAFCALGT